MYLNNMWLQCQNAKVCVPTVGIYESIKLSRIRALQIFKAAQHFFKITSQQSIDPHRILHHCSMSTVFYHEANVLSQIRIGRVCLAKRRCPRIQFGCLSTAVGWQWLACNAPYGERKQLPTYTVTTLTGLLRNGITYNSVRIRSRK